MKTNSIEVTLKDYAHVAHVLADSKLIDTTNNVIDATFHRLRNRPVLPKGEVYIKSLYEKMNDDGLTVGCSIQFKTETPSKNCTLEISYIKRKARLLDE